MTMETYHDIASARAALRRIRARGERIVAVPTMGNLHQGHLALVEEARKHGDHVVATIFVNPMQFGENEDFDAYPRTLEADREQLRTYGCDSLFAPSAGDMYPDGLQAQTVVSVPGLSRRHCGASRPGHFDGVTTVVNKLFNILEPDAAVFGRKDYQQLQIIRKMVRDLCLPIGIIGVATQRDAQGLALSSRNAYLSTAERDQALQISHNLRLTAQAMEQGRRDFAVLEKEALRRLRDKGLQPDYFHICHSETLEPASPEDRELIILAAAWVGNTRLIDNTALTVTTSGE